MIILIFTDCFYIILYPTNYKCVSVNIFTLNISFIKIWSKLSVHFSEQYISKDMSPSQIVSQIIWYASGKAQLIKVGLSLTDISSLL